MKKIIIITILFLSIGSSVNAGPFVKFEAGPSLNVDNVYFTEAIIGYSFKFWEIESKTYGGWLTWSEYYNNGFYPFMNTYSINQKFLYKNIFIKYKHYCSHPSINRTKSYQDENNNIIYTDIKPNPYWWNGEITTISIGFEYEWK